jgi:hypothetical protein
MCENANGSIASAFGRTAMTAADRTHDAGGGLLWRLHVHSLVGLWATGKWRHE